MLRRTMIALVAAASVCLVATNAASARGGFGGGFHGGGFHGGGFHGGGFHGGGFHGGGFHGGFGGFHHHGFGPAFGFGFGLYPFYYGGYDPYYYPDDWYPDYGYGVGPIRECYLVRRHVHTRHGWRLRTFRVCN